MSKSTRLRIDYMPGLAAQAVLAEAVKQFPNLNNQAIIDKLLITGMSALRHQHWQPPALFGNDRDKWRHLQNKGDPGI